MLRSIATSMPGLARREPRRNERFVRGEPVRARTVLATFRDVAMTSTLSCEHAFDRPPPETARAYRDVYGCEPRGCLLARGRGWAVRWRELEVAPDGTLRRVLRYETLEPMSRREATQILAQKLAAASDGSKPTRSRVTFATLATEWQETVLPMYKHSTQKHRRFMLKKHLRITTTSRSRRSTTAVRTRRAWPGRGSRVTAD